MAATTLNVVMVVRQFITLQLEIDGQHVSRCYTISSPPTRPHLIAITVKRMVGGSVSNWLHDNVIPGARIAVQAPLGSFTTPVEMRPSISSYPQVAVSHPSCR